jgi:uncharacterized protein involved in exopolysaccharide biosynthesis
VSDTQEDNDYRPAGNRYYLEMGSVPDSMSLLDVWDAITNRKKLIFLVTIFFVSISALLVIVVPTKYEADCIVAESNPVVSTNTGSNTTTVDIGVEVEANEAIAMITTRRFITKYITDNNLMPVLFEDDWDSTTGDWKVTEDGTHPTLLEGYEDFIDDVLDVSTDDETSLTTVSAQWTDAKLAAHWANDIVAQVNEIMRQRAIDEATKALEYLNKTLRVTTAVELKQSIYELVKVQKAEIVAANIHNEYAFKIIDPAVVPEEPAIPYLEYILPSVGLIIGLFLGITLALLLNLISSARKRREQKGIDA